MPQLRLSLFCHLQSSLSLHRTAIIIIIIITEARGAHGDLNCFGPNEGYRWLLTFLLVQSMDMQISNRDQRLNLSSPTSTPENSISSFSYWRTLRTPETVVFSPIHSVIRWRSGFSCFLAPRIQNLRRRSSRLPGNSTFPTCAHAWPKWWIQKIIFKFTWSHHLQWL